MSIWVKITEGSICYEEIIGTDGSPTNYFGVWMTLNDIDSISIGYGDGGITEPSNRRTKKGATSLALDTWYHVAGVIRGAEDMDIYINGVRDGGSYSGSGGSLRYSSNNATIGGKSYLSCNLNGAIDDVRIYDRALSADEVEQLYQTPGLVAV